MMKLTRKLGHTLVGIVMSITFVCVLASVTGFVSIHDQYAPDPKGPSAQVEALCDGHLSISQNPEHILLDYAYYKGNVQQIWGLGVPLLQSVVLCLIPIPDRIFLFIFLCIAAFFIYWQSRTLLSVENNKWVELKGACIGVFSVFLIFFLPASVSLMRTRFLVYEETIYYGYIISVCMFFLARINFKHTFSVAAIGLIFGAAGSIRPTVAVYGLVAAFISYFTLKSTKLRRILAISFVCGLSILLLTNYLRFGSITEFGHTLNLSYDDTINTYQLKFDYEYKHESFINAGRELFGILFLSKPTIRGAYLENKFPLQSPTIRWRSVYNYTYNLAYVGILLITLIVWRRKKEVLWIIIPLLFLIMFYFYSPSISGRYMLDFGAIFSVAAVLLFATVSKQPRVNKILIHITIVVMLFVWVQGLVAEFNQKKKSDNVPGHTPIVRDYLRPNDLSQISDSYPAGYFIQGLSMFNGSGWKTTDGTASSSVILFFDNPREIIVTFSGVCNYLDKVLQLRIGNHIFNSAKIGEYSYRFAISEEYQKGVWPVFLKLLPVEKVKENTTECRLMEIKNQ